MAELKRKRIQIVDNSHQFKPFFWELEYITITEDHPAQRWHNFRILTIATIHQFVDKTVVFTKYLVPPLKVRINQKF